MLMMMYAVAKDSSSPLVLKLTLHSLVSCWQPDLKFITDDHCVHDKTGSCTAPCTRPSITQLIGADGELILTGNNCYSLSVVVQLAYISMVFAG